VINDKNLLKKAAYRKCLLYYSCLESNRGPRWNDMVKNVKNLLRVWYLIRLKEKLEALLSSVFINISLKKNYKKIIIILILFYYIL